MQRFLLQQNIARFQSALDKEQDGPLRQTLVSMLASTERELALLCANRLGAAQFCQSNIVPAGIAEFRHQFEQADMPSMLLDARAGIHIVDMNEPYAASTLVNRNRVVGQCLFDVFPDNPSDAAADGVSKLYASLKQVAETGRRHTMAVQRYDVRNADGAFEKRYWQPHNIPVHNDTGRLMFILHQATDVTDRFLNTGNT